MLLKRVINIFVLCLIILFIVFFTKYLFGKSKNVSELYQFDYLTKYKSLSINGIMLTSDLRPAFWMGEKFNNKYIIEPINVIIIDDASLNKEDSINNLEEACSKVGYRKEKGHSSGYSGLINGEIVSQIPKENRVAFSDNKYWKVNNHGRFFGPYSVDDKSWIYIGQFSREKFILFATIHHKYISFNESRNDFADKMNSLTDYKIKEKIDFNNVINEISISSGDHDGNVIVLELKEKEI